MKRIYLLLLLLTLLPVAALAQTPAALESAEMKKLDFLVGQWRGEGWMEFGSGPRRTFKINESAQLKVDGAVMVLEGLGTTKMGDKAEEVPVHKAFAIVEYNVEAKRFSFRAYRAGTGVVEVAPVVGDKSLIWGFKDARGGDVRFTLKINEKGQWFEIGEYSGDGTTWRKFLEMTLDRVK